MEQYYEESAAGQKNKRNEILYVLCWLLIVICLIFAMIFASCILVDSSRTLTYTGRDVLEVNWLWVVGSALCLLAGGVLFMQKDRLRTEYDYILHGTVLEISGVYNARRRRVLAEIPLECIQQMGPINDTQIQKLSKHPQMKQHNWYVNVDASRYYLIYMKENSRRMAILELSDEMLTAIRKSGKLSRNVWRNEEGKTSDYASIS